MPVNKWKTIAIIFIIIAVLEFVFICWAWSLGNKAIVGGDTCAYEVCDLDNMYTDHTAYYFDSYNDMCYCYSDDEIVKKQKI